jgi:hypothetical protein
MFLHVGYHFEDTGDRLLIAYNVWLLAKCYTVILKGFDPMVTDIVIGFNYITQDYVQSIN